MSDLSDAMKAADQKVAPKPKPPAAKPEAPYDPLGLRSRVSTGDPRITTTKKAAATSAKDTGSAFGALGEALGYGNTGGILFGAAMQDKAMGRNPLENLTSDANVTKKGWGANTATAHALNLLEQGKSIEAADRYFPTSPTATKVFAKAGYKPAQYLQVHQKQAAAVDAVARFLDPTNAVMGGVFTKGMEVAGAGTRVAGRSAAAGISKMAPQYAEHPLVNVLRYPEHLDERFGQQRSAAEDIARKAGKSEKQITEAGNDAEMDARNLANAGHYGRAEGEEVAERVFGDLDKADQFEVVHLHEGTSDLLKGKRTPEQQAQFDRLMPRVKIWRQYGAELDKKTQQWIGPDAKLLSPARYFPRKGYAMKPGQDALSDGEEAMLDAARSRGGITARKGTLAQHRKYATLKEMQAEATATGRFDLNPDWTPKQALTDHVATRAQANRIYDQMLDLERVGLVVPKWKEAPVTKRVWFATKAGLPRETGPKPEVIPDELRAAVGKQIASERASSVGLTAQALKPGVSLTPDLYQQIARDTMKPGFRSIRRTVAPGIPQAQPAGFQPFTAYGDIRTFGLPLARESYIHPSVHSLLAETRGTKSEDLPGAAGLVTDTLGAFNRLAAQWQVLFAPYHVGFNLRANVASALKSPQEWKRFIMGTMSPSAIAKAKATGAFRPYTSPEFLEKGPKALRPVAKAFQNVSAMPLYKYLEPRIAAGLQSALEPRLGRSGAALEARSILGEPENISNSMRTMASNLEFPAWFLSQLRRWGTLPFRRPEIYNSSHAAIQDYNSSAGRGKQPGDEGRIFPPITLGYDKNGDRVVIDIPHPADRPVRFMGAMANMMQGKGSPTDVALSLVGGANPLEQPFMHQTLSTLKAGESASDWQHDVARAAPPDQSSPLMRGLKGVGAQAMQDLQFYGGVLPQLVHTELAGTRDVHGKKMDAQKLRTEIIASYVYGNRKFGPDFKYGILYARNKADKAKKANNDTEYQKATTWANKRYAMMQATLKKYGFDQDPLAPSNALAPLYGIPAISSIKKGTL